MPVDPNNPEVLTSVRTDVEAAAIVGALAARGIEASTTGGYTAGFHAGGPGYVNVIVKYAHLDCARHALVEIEQDQPDVDKSHNVSEAIGSSIAPHDVVCPNCGSTEVYFEGFNWRLVVLSFLLLGLPLPFLRKRYTCDGCKHGWNRK